MIHMSIEETIPKEKMLLPTPQGDEEATTSDMLTKSAESEIDVDKPEPDDNSGGGGDKVACGTCENSEDSLPRSKPSATDFSTHFVIHRHSHSNENEVAPPVIESDDVDTPTSSSSEASSAIIINVAKEEDADFDTDTNEEAKKSPTPGATCTLPEEKVNSKNSEPEPVTSTPLAQVAVVPRRTSPRFQHPFMKPQISPITPKIGSPLSIVIKIPSSPMDSTYEPISAHCIQEYVNDSVVKRSDLLAEKIANKSPLAKTLRACGQRSAIPIGQIFKNLKNLKKIGEGVYGEVYSGTFRSVTQFSWVYKIVAIEGEAFVNGERQRKFLEILPEILISQKLNQLKYGHNNCKTDGYVLMRNARIATGKYPDRLVKAWEKYDTDYDSDNDKPKFPPDQLYMILEFEFAGEDIEAIIFKDALQSLSIILQVAHILAVGESALEFEHRDLHWGNVMVESTKCPEIPFLFEGKTSLVPSRGVKVNMIDFTMSRLKDSETSDVICLDLQDDDEQFLGTGDHQFDIYRMMRDYNRNEWQRYCPKSNVFWLHYLAHKFSVKGHYKERSKDGEGDNSNSRSIYHKRATEMLFDFSHEILECDSASDFVESDACEMYKKFLMLKV